jgi:hypothetical protein
MASLAYGIIGGHGRDNGVSHRGSALSGALSDALPGAHPDYFSPRTSSSDVMRGAGTVRLGSAARIMAIISWAVMLARSCVFMIRGIAGAVPSVFFNDYVECE